MTTIVILGTARNDSNTLSALKELCPFADYQLIDLRNLKIDLFSYDGPSQDDDFLQVARQMGAATHIVFATPVYWYSMSATLKIFFDRLTDLLSIYKHIGCRALLGKG